MTVAEQRYIDALCAAFQFEMPEDCLTWAQRQLHLTKRVTPEPGAYQIDSRPYIRAIFDALQDGKTHTVVMCWGTQLGKTLTLGVWLAYRIAVDPAPILLVMPTEGQARSYSETRLRPLFDSSKAVKAKYPSDKNKLKHLEMHFADCTLNLVGSNSPGQISSRPIEILLGDELDKWADASAKESSALHLAMERTKAFPRARHVFTSTPTVPYGDIWIQFLRGTQERYHIPCPSCGKFNHLDFRRDIRWDQEARHPSGQWDLAAVSSSARWHCPACDAPMHSADKVKAMQAGHWQAANDSAEPGVRSFHLSSLYSPTTTFGMAAVKFLSAKRDPAGLQNFINGWLAEPFEEKGSGAEDEDILSCRGNYRKGTCPIEPYIITLCADPGLLETHWSIGSWTLHGECYIIDYGTVLAPEDCIDLIEKKSWKTPLGEVVRINAGLIDSGDFAERIYDICNRCRILYPSKGSGARDGKELVRASNLAAPDVILYTYSDYHLKVSLYVDKLSKKLAPRLWFPMDSEENFLRGLMGQRLVFPKGGKRKEWRKLAGDHFGDTVKLQLVGWNFIQDSNKEDIAAKLLAASEVSA